MPSEVRPYLIPRAGTVDLEPWQLLDGDWMPLPEQFDGWDAGTDLVLRRTGRIDLDRLRSETGLDAGQVAIVVSWRSSTTGMRSAAPPVRLGSKGLCVIEARLAGERLGGTVDIRTTLCLTAQPPEHRVGVAQMLGSVLVEDSHSVVLDRGDQLFPVDAIDFASTRLPAEASWHLETTTDLSAPFFSSYRVLVNARDTEFARAVARGARDRRQQALLDELEAGVTALLLELAIMLQDELKERSEWPVDSVGDVLGRTLESSRVQVPQLTAATELAVFRTHLAAAVRSAGKGRAFT